MEITQIGIATIALIALTIARPLTWGLVIFGATLPLRTAAAINLPAFGDTSIIVTQLLIGALFAGVALRGHWRRQALTILQRNPAVLSLLAFVLYAGVSAIMLPRFFVGAVPVFSFSRDDVGLTTLRPNTGNITQSLYLVSEFLLFWVMVFMVTMPQGLTRMGQMINVMTVVHISFAIFDAIPAFAGFLEIFRTANYDILIGHEVAGFKRIIGSYSEASSFGAASCVIFAYNFTRFIQTRGLWFLTASGASLICLAAAFSSTAFVVFGLLTALWSVSVIFSLVLSRGIGREQIYGLVILGVSATTVTAFFFIDGLRDIAVDMFNRLIGTKLSSDSGVERSSWNMQALQNAIDTFGFGVGLGGARTSSLLTALISNTGFIGFIMFSIFLIISVFRGFPRVRPSNRTKEYLIKLRYFAASRSSVIAGFLAGAVSATTVDQGAMFFVFAAIGAGAIATHRFDERKRAKMAETSNPPRFAVQLPTLKGAFPGKPIRFGAK